MDPDGPDSLPFVIATADWKQDRAAIRSVREAVFIHERGMDRRAEWDGVDPVCIHLLAYTLEGQPLATARMTPDGVIGHIAVLHAWRGQGIGSALLQTLVDLAAAHGLERVFIDSRPEEREFFHRHGFLADPAADPGAPTLRMARHCTDPEDPACFDSSLSPARPA